MLLLYSYLPRQNLTKIMTVRKRDPLCTMSSHMIARELIYPFCEQNPNRQLVFTKTVRHFGRELHPSLSSLNNADSD